MHSYTCSRNRPGKTQQTGIFCGKSFIAYIFRSKRARALLLTSLGARVQERKSSIAYIFRSQSARAQESKSFIAYIFRSKKQEKEQEQESKRKNKSKRENGKTPSLLRRIILRLGRVTP